MHIYECKCKSASCGVSYIVLVHYTALMIHFVLNNSLKSKLYSSLTICCFFCIFTMQIALWRFRLRCSAWLYLRCILVINASVFEWPAYVILMRDRTNNTSSRSNTALISLVDLIKRINRLSGSDSMQRLEAYRITTFGYKLRSDMSI